MHTVKFTKRIIIKRKEGIIERRSKRCEKKIGQAGRDGGKKNSPVPLVVENAKHHAAKDQHHLPRSSAPFFSREKNRGEENLDSSFRASERRGEKEERDRGTTERDSTIRRGVQCTRPLDG